jgi:hypothetical protein
MHSQNMGFCDNVQLAACTAHSRLTYAPCNPPVLASAWPSVAPAKLLLVTGRAEVTPEDATA